MTWSALWQWNTWCHSPQWKLFLTIGCKFPINTRWRRDFARSCQWWTGCVSAVSASLSLVKVAVVQAGPGQGWLAGWPGLPRQIMISQRSHQARRAHHTSTIQSQRHASHVSRGLRIMDQPCDIQNNLWRDRASFSSSHKVRRSIHLITSQHLSQLVLHPYPAVCQLRQSNMLLRGRDHFQ